MLSKDLTCHIDTQCNVELTVQVFINAKLDQRLQLRYELNANLSQLCIPEPQAEKAVDSLWRHTCFELFVAVEGDADYHEFNFSPSGQWAAYAFSDYRIAKTRAFNNKPIIHCSEHHKQLVLDVSISAADLPLNPNNKPFLLGLSAVLEDNNYCLSYWALQHPPGVPDFHHRYGFSCKILL
jgi:hypothetical protein